MPRPRRHAPGPSSPGLDLYLVGGFVRDLLLDVRNLDIELVVAGDAIRFAAEVADLMGGRLKGHHQFATATVTLPARQRSPALPKLAFRR